MKTKDTKRKLVPGWRVVGSWILTLILIVWLTWRITIAFSDRRNPLPGELEYFITTFFIIETTYTTIKYAKEGEERRRRLTAHIKTDGRLPWDLPKD